MSPAPASLSVPLSEFNPQPFHLRRAGRCFAVYSLRVAVLYSAPIPFFIVSVVCILLPGWCHRPLRLQSFPPSSGLLNHPDSDKRSHTSAVRSRSAQPSGRLSRRVLCSRTLFHRLSRILRDPAKEIRESNMAVSRQAATSLRHLFAMPCPFIALGLQLDGDVVKAGGAIVIAGGFLALFPGFSLGVTIIALGQPLITASWWHD